MAELLMRAAAQVGMSSVVAEGWGTVTPAGVARGDCDTAAAGLWVGGWQMCTPQPQPGRAPSLALQPGTHLLCVLPSTCVSTLGCQQELSCPRCSVSGQLPCAVTTPTLT